MHDAVGRATALARSRRRPLRRRPLVRLDRAPLRDRGAASASRARARRGPRATRRPYEPEPAPSRCVRRKTRSPAAGWRRSRSSPSASVSWASSSRRSCSRRTPAASAAICPRGASPRAAGPRSRTSSRRPCSAPPSGLELRRTAARGALALPVGGPRRRPRRHPDRASDGHRRPAGSRDERPAPRAAQSAAGRRRPSRPASTCCTTSSSRTTMLGATFVFLLALLFLVRSRRRAPGELTTRAHGSAATELALMGGLLTIFIVFWIVGATQYDRMMTPPPDAIPVYVTAKQWMWKFSYADGRSSMDVLTVPVGRPIKLVMTSRDVIHSFYVPAFRMKHDVVPGRYYAAWFQATTARDLRHPLRRVLRREPLEDARLRPRALGRRLRSLAGDDDPRREPRPRRRGPRRRRAARLPRAATRSTASRTSDRRGPASTGRA